MAALPFRWGWKPSPTAAAGSDPAPLLRARPSAARLRSTTSIVSTRRSDLILKRELCPIGTTRPLKWALIKHLPVLSASLATDAVAACASVFHVVVVPVINAAPLLVSRVSSVVQELPPTVQLSAASLGLIGFALWCLDPPVRFIWGSITKADSNWEKCQTRTVLRSYVRPLMLWAGIITMCRALDSAELPSEASTAIKLRLTHFMRSLTTVSVFALCTGSLIQQVQKHLMKRSSLKDSRSVSLPFIGNAVSTSVWVAAVCLFLELLGFSTHRWLAAGGFGTVLLTLAGREIFTNFLSSMMIHATKPFVESEWIQTKIEGQEVIGTVEHVGWWSPTVIRGDDREAVLVPNHKFSVSVVRNLTQKTHWRVKTHIAINHNDVKKISKIVADMRKVIANHPEIEQKRLHRRVFFDYVSSQNLALMIMISCFVKTSRFEKYLRVKEGLLLDLLKVVSHHGGRLATPVRSMQRHVEEPEPQPQPQPRPVNYNYNYNSPSHPRPILLTATLSSTSKPSSSPTSSSSSADDDNADHPKPPPSPPNPEHKVDHRKQSSKEPSPSPNTAPTVTVTISTDQGSSEQADSLSRWKAMKKMEAAASSSSSSRASDGSSGLGTEDVKEPDNRRLESNSQRDI